MMVNERTAADPTDDVADLSPQALREALQNLRLHQIELEMQNDELRRTQAALDTAQARYFDFYDLAPVGYVTVSEKAVILQANLTTAALLGVPRGKVVGKVLPGFLFAPDADRYYLMCQEALVSASAQSCELRLRKPDGNTAWVKLQAIAATGDDGAAVIRMVVSDISERIQVEAVRQVNRRFRDAILDSVLSQIAVLDPTGTIVAVNQTWRNFALENSATPGEPGSNTGVGVNYLDICQRASTADTDGHAALVRDGIMGVIQGRAASFQLECPCQTPTQQLWFSLAVTPLNLDDHSVVVTHTDITQRRQLEQAAKEASEHKFRLVADNTSDGIVIFGADRHIEYVSPAYVKQLGYSEAEELWRPPDMIFALIHPQDRDALFARLECAIESKQNELLYQYRIQHRLGHYIWREDNARFQYDGLGNYSGACVVARDITERRAAEVDLRIAAAAFETQEAMMITDEHSVILRVNRSFTQVTGYTAEEAVGQTPKLLQSGHHDKDFYRQLWAVVNSAGSWQGEVWDRHKDGRVYPKWLTITAVSGIDGAVSHYIGTHFDLSERKRAESAMLEMNSDLTQTRQQLRQLLVLNETKLENEKRHIAREVHDELGQVLTALRMNLTLAAVRHAGPVPELLDALNGMKTQVDRAIQGVRNVASSLRPPELDLGLVTSVEWLCNEFTRHGGVACELRAAHEAIECDASRAVVVFRIVQESLTNISKYAQASQVVVSLVRRANELSVEVRDNGLGFDPATVARSGSLGLLGMRERAIALGGRVEVNSTPGQGTVIDLLIPLDPDGVGGAA
jgi:PAS domain S-box-containing protein